MAFFRRELALLTEVRAIIALGAFAWDGVLRALPAQKPRPKFGHGARAKLGAYTLFGSYHVSQQNTFTGRLTEPMLDAVFASAQREADHEP
jgi:uracil-DNA glycosylase